MTATQSQIRDALLADGYAVGRDKHWWGENMWNHRETIRTILQSALDTQKPNCETCEGLGRIDMLPDDGTHTHPCEDCQPEASAEWQRGYDAALYNPEPQKPAGDELDRQMVLVNDVMKEILEEERAALNGDCGGGEHPPIEGLEAAINNSIIYPMVNDVGFQSEHDRRVVMQAARRYLALTADNAKRGEVNRTYDEAMALIPKAARAIRSNIEGEAVNGGHIAALKLAAKTFRLYEQLHRAKPDHEKADRNKHFAEVMELALADNGLIEKVIQPTCGCCGRTVESVRESIWHGISKICSECFMMWYETGQCDLVVLRLMVLKAEKDGTFPFKSK